MSKQSDIEALASFVKIYEGAEHSNRYEYETLKQLIAENKQYKLTVKTYENSVHELTEENELLKTALKDMVDVNKRLKIFQEDSK